MNEPLRVGLVGAGPWAQVFTAPMLAADERVEFTGIWARRGDAAQALALAHGTVAVDSPDELFDACEAVAFALPPDVQAQYAGTAVQAGKHILIDKPTGLDVAAAQRFADVVGSAGVVSQIVLTNRYLPTMRQLYADAGGFDAYGGHAIFLGGGAIPGHFFGTPWRLEHGGLLDLGAHVFDALHACLGPIARLTARGHAHRLITVVCEHESGNVSQATMSGTCAVDPSGLGVELYGPSGMLAAAMTDLTAEQMAAEFVAAQGNIVSEFVDAIRSGTGHRLDAAHGAYLQRLIDEAAVSLDQ
jgi:predicted dehydrogenase